MPKKDYSRKKFTHPLRQRKKRPALIGPSLKKHLIRLVFAGGAIGVLWVTLFSPWLKVKNIVIEGNLRSDAYTTAWRWLGRESMRKLYGKFSGNHIFFIRTKELENALMEDELIDSVVIEKKFPSSLVIGIEERTASFTYVLDGVRYILDSRGSLLEVTEKPIEKNDAYSSLPIVYGTSTSPMIVNNESSFTPQLTKFIKRLSVEFSKFFENLAIVRFAIGDNGNTITAMTSEGWYALLDPTTDIMVQLSNLSRVYKEVVSESRKKRLEYIDVRIENYAYYK